jgi:hypothetical protein
MRERRVGKLKKRPFHARNAQSRSRSGFPGRVFSYEELLKKTSKGVSGKGWGFFQGGERYFLMQYTLFYT